MQKTNVFCIFYFQDRVVPYDEKARILCARPQPPRDHLTLIGVMSRTRAFLSGVSPLSSGSTQHDLLYTYVKGSILALAQRKS